MGEGLLLGSVAEYLGMSSDSRPETFLAKLSDTLLCPYWILFLSVLVFVLTVFWEMA